MTEKLDPWPGEKVTPPRYAVRPAPRLSIRDRAYLRAYGKLILCERRQPDEERELRRRRLADGSYPVPRQLDDTLTRPLLDPRLS